MKREFDEKLKETSDRSMKTTFELLEELKAASDLVGSLIYHVPPDSRKAVISDARNGMIKELISEDIEKRPYIGDIVFEAMESLYKARSGGLSFEGRAQAAKQMLKMNDEEPKQ